ncbi:hypothetical protein [Guptibacillus algicola]|uniref:hypothetical protein n=1 Tax=Guptibacillus algicola TaxID=225844 RepID=UPI001CD73334|nr:hypothetical protein [Alkalihalobacillus algicola]MCA0988370.1 hypothetical protein [Alkalihalobacillus algicola]
MKKATKGLLTILLFSVLAFSYLKVAEVYVDYKNDKYKNTASAISLDISLHQKIEEQNIYEIHLHSLENAAKEVVTSNEDEEKLIKWINKFERNNITEVPTHRVTVEKADIIIYFKTGKEMRINVDDDSIVISRNDNENKKFKSYLVNDYSLTEDIRNLLGK